MADLDESVLIEAVLVRLVELRVSSLEKAARTAVDAVLPFLTDALDRARQQGRDEAAAAIEAAIVRHPIDPDETVTARTMRQIHADWDMDAARLARGGPNRKDEE